MIVPRGLIFKTLLGVVAAGGIITPTVVFKKEILNLFNGKSEEDSVVENGESSDDDISSGSNQGVSSTSSSQITGSQQTSDPTVGPEKQPEEVDNLGIPKSCNADQAKSGQSKTCELTKEQLGKIKFEPKDSSITIDGLTGSGETVTLTIEDKTSDTINYPKGKKYSFKAKSDGVKIKGTKDGDIILEKNKGVDFREKQNGGQLETVEDSLGIPKSCKADQAKNNSPQTCQLTQEQLGKIKFEPKSSGGSISVSGLTSGDKVTLTISDVSTSSTEKANYPKNKKYNFKTASAQKTATISGTKGDNITINDKGVDFREKNENVLEKVTVVQPQVTTTDSLGLPTSCGSNQVTKEGDEQTCQLGVEDLKKVKFKELSDTGTSVTGLTDPNNKITLTISWNNDNSTYPGNKKYSFDNSKNNSEVKITKDKQEVKIAQKTESWFKNEGNKLTLVKTKLDVQKEAKMKEVNEELVKLGLSDLKLEKGDFKNADSVGFAQKKATLDETAMKKIQFSELGGAPTDISGWNDKSKIMLEFDYTSETIYLKNMKFTFKNTSGEDITIKKDKKSLKFQNGKSETFKVINGKLTRPYNTSR